MLPGSQARLKATLAPISEFLNVDQYMSQTLHDLVEKKLISKTRYGHKYSSARELRSSACHSVPLIHSTMEIFLRCVLGGLRKAYSHSQLPTESQIIKCYDMTQYVSCFWKRQKNFVSSSST